MGTIAGWCIASNRRETAMGYVAGIELSYSTYVEDEKMKKKDIDKVGKGIDDIYVPHRLDPR